jgi:hypothetical protein
VTRIESEQQIPVKLVLNADLTYIQDTSIMIRDSILKDPLCSVWSPRKKKEKEIQNRHKRDKSRNPRIVEAETNCGWEFNFRKSCEVRERERERESLEDRERKSAAVGIWDSVRHVREFSR